MQIKPINVHQVEQPKTTDAEENLYNSPLLNEPRSNPTKTAASIRAILKNEKNQLKIIGKTDLILKINNSCFPY